MNNREGQCTALTLKGILCKNSAKVDGRCRRHANEDTNTAVITITFCECSENHIGMEQNGSKQQTGFTELELTHACERALELGLQAELYDLHALIENPTEGEKSWVLVIRGAVDNMLKKYELTQADAYRQLLG